MKTLREMTARELNTLKDRALKTSSALVDEMINSGRGYERPTETYTKTDDLSLRCISNWDLISAILDEMERRYGSRIYSLPVK
jgi:hypothetical protein